MIKLTPLMIALILAACSSSVEPTEDENSLAEAQTQITELEAEIVELKNLVSQRDEQNSRLTSEMVSSSERRRTVDKRRAADLERRRVEADADYEKAQRNLEKIVKDVGQ